MRELDVEESLTFRALADHVGVCLRRIGIVQRHIAEYGSDGRIEWDDLTRDELDALLSLRRARYATAIGNLAAFVEAHQ